ncbi:hypothetical protein PV08_06577 [Exophiala spinifera]|uniref:FAD/NAD(P)-binding domain-containing protein n=1 Tax=Exophiala spinifera TaxID=91928 RepID=A0A0D1ZUZ6_9EURO|nr:uncharacterized protein PV08_06577 [Exophiala spinifera]KIW16522.1 hypothetical protein PV08_06577 [Exophiala spinifera]
MAQSAVQKNIVILGGSYGGISTAHYLLKHVLPHLPEHASYQLILVSTSDQVMCRPACPRAMISDELLPQEKLFISIPKAFDHYRKMSFRFVQGTAVGLDHATRNVTIKQPTGESEIIDFHALVIATGASTQSPLLGLNQDVNFLRTNWATFREALKAAKTIVIAGGGPTGIEIAGELGQYLNGQAGWFRSTLTQPRVEITVVTAGSYILPVLRTTIAKQAEHYLAKLGVTVIKNSRVKAIEPEEAGTTDIASKATITLENGKMLKADLFIPAMGTIPNTGFVDRSLLTSDGRVDTNASTLRVDKAGPRIYAIGDVFSGARPAVHNVLSAVPVLATNIERDLLYADGHQRSIIGKDRNFKEDKRETQLVPIGQSKGVGAAMGYQLPSFMVWLIKGRDYWLWTTGNLWSGKQWEKKS